MKTSLTPVRRTSRTNTIRNFAAWAVVICTTCSAAGAKEPAPDRPIGHAMQLAHWESFYESLLSPPDSGPFDNIPGGPPPSRTHPMRTAGIWD